MDKLAPNAMADRDTKEGLYKILGMVGHDISTPITVIDQYFGLLRDGVLGPIEPRQQQAFEVLQKHSDRLKKIMADLERVTSWEKIWDHAKKSVEAMDIQDCAQEAFAELDILFGSKQQKVSWIRKTKAVTVTGHRDSLRAVFAHLLVNAFKFTPCGACITVGIEDGKKEVKVTVEDNGRGMKPETLQHVFDSFYVGADNQDLARDVPKHVSSRLGLGLAICRQIVESHGGKIGVESELGKFARFWFVLPKQKGADHA